MTLHTIGSSSFGSLPWAGPAFDPTPTGQHGILFTTTSISLDWTEIDEAITYQLQISLFPDFRTTIVDDTTSFSFYNFTDSSTNDAKRYWRYKSNDGTSPWSEVGSYWLDTGAAAPITLTRSQWSLADPDTTTDIYYFDLLPMFLTVPMNLFRIQERNRLGDLLSEFLTIKWQVTLNFMGSQYVDHPQLDEFRRYHNDIRTVFLCAFIDGKWHTPMPHIWKVEFMQDPVMTMIAAGRQDLLTGSLIFQEV